MKKSGFALRLIALSSFVLSACSDDEIAPAEVQFDKPETAVEYDVRLSGVDRENAADLIVQASELWRKQEDGAQSLAFLRRRAEGDVGTVLKVMRSYGYFEATVETEIIAPEDRRPGDNVPEAVISETDGEPEDVAISDENEPEEVAAAEQPAAAEANADDAAADAEPRALVLVKVNEGKRYILAAHNFLLLDTGAGDPPAQPDLKAIKSPVGKAARADRILDAEANAVADYRKSGRPYAKFIGREAVADREKAELEVQSTINTGHKYTIGGVTYEGLETIDKEYLDTYIPFGEGDIADPAKLTEFQRALVATGLFDTGSATFPETPPEGDVAPVVVKLEEAKHQTVSAGVKYSSDTGPAVTGGYEHRNLFGANETLTIESEVGIDEQSLDGRYRVPQWLRPGQDQVYGLSLRHIDDDAYEEYGVTFAAGVERELSPQLTVGFGGQIEYSRIDDGEGFENSYLFGIPVFADYDNTDDPLDPSKGFRTRAQATPFAGTIGGTPASFLALDGTASTYLDLTGSRKYILALRGRLGSIVAGNTDIVAANHRLYSGGGGSVRGYKERFIGPLDDDDDPEGGLSVLELGTELRYRINETLGVAGFVEAGSVSTDVVPTFDESIQVAAGGGVRYFSPIGPLRVDFGIPVNPRKVDDFFQFYISIGQAF